MSEPLTTVATISPETDHVLKTTLAVSSIAAVCEGARLSLRDVIPQRYHFLAIEAIYTFELCLFRHQLLLLSEFGNVELPVLLPIVYTTVVLHSMSSSCGLCNPCTSLQKLMIGKSDFGRTIEKIIFQFGGAIGAWVCARQVLLTEITNLYVLAGPECTSHLHISVQQGALAELGCSFVFQSVQQMLPLFADSYHAHILGLTYAGLAAAAGHLTGAMFNPAVALSLNFFCKGTNISDNMFVYWLGPIAGMILAVALFDHIFPTLKRLTGGETGTLKID
ncbi:aquaporin-11 isoform X2 [Pleurodeles waltl]|uniref:aquaporin-11 isoform X2 n=1 Tax=Pleurodeles waltl TaxID=8319 RepID=UPI00370980BF